MDLKEHPNDPVPSPPPKLTITPGMSLGAQEGLNFRFSEGADKESGLSFLQWTVLISIAVHVLLLIAYFVILKFFPALLVPPPVANSGVPQVLSTRVMTLKDLQRLEGKSRNIVDTSKGHEVQNPKDLAPYLGEHTQRVEKQTVAKGFGNATGGEKSTSQGETSDEEKKAHKGSKKSAPKRVSKDFGFGALIPEEKESEARKKRNAREGDGTTYGNHDLVQNDAVVSTETLLNTDEYKYAGFFNRLKSEVAPRWEPLVQSIISDRSLRIRPGLYSTQTRFTVNRAGDIVRVDIIRSSGAAPFDEAAKASINQILHIQNLPADLQDGDGLYRIELGFMVNLGQSGLQMDYVPDPRLQDR